MFLGFFKIASSAVIQIFILGALGYLLVKRNFLRDEGLNILSRLSIDITLPIMIFCQLSRNFTFGFYADWYVFPLISIVLTILGLGIGWFFSQFIHGHEHKMQFLSLAAFQNSGYLPLALVAALLPESEASTMFIYIFLFLIGFNSLMFSLGLHMLTFTKDKKFELMNLFSPPVLTTLMTLILVFFKVNQFVPEFVFRPLKMIGDTTLPLAMLVIGGSLAQIKLRHINKKAMALLVLAKLVILPVLGLLFLFKFRLPNLIGLLILIELVVPSATSNTLIIRQYNKEDLLISQGVFLTHILSIISIPVFLSLYFTLSVIK
jgi:predicted permease